MGHVGALVIFVLVFYAFFLAGRVQLLDHRVLQTVLLEAVKAQAAHQVEECDVGAEASDQVVNCRSLGRVTPPSRGLRKLDAQWRVQRRISRRTLEDALPHVCVGQ